MARKRDEEPDAVDPEEEFETLDLEALLAAVRDEPDLDRVRIAWWVALRRIGVCDAVPQDTLLLPEAMTDAQRRFAEALAAREGVATVSWGIPGTKRLLLRWLGRTPPTALERRITVVRDGVEVTWPVWKAWQSAPDELTEYGQGVPSDVAAQLTAAELIEAAGESVLEEGYGLGYPFEARLKAAFNRAEEAAPWARTFLDDLVRLCAGRALREVPGYESRTHATATLIGTLALIPLVRAGVAIEPEWDAFVPHDGADEHVSALLGALPLERREAVVWRGLTTTWGPNGDQCINGFSANLRALEHAPSLRNARFVVSQYRNCRRSFAKSRDQIVARLEALAAKHPEVAEAMKPKRASKSADAAKVRANAPATKRKSATTERKSATAKKKRS